MLLLVGGWRYGQSAIAKRAGYLHKRLFELEREIDLQLGIEPREHPDVEDEETLKYLARRKAEIERMLRFQMKKRPRFR